MISNINGGFSCITLSQGMPLVKDSCMLMMGTFESFTQTDIRKFLKRSTSAFYVVDPMPIWLVKGCLDFLKSSITNIVNKSLSLGVFPRFTKAALIKPLIKKYGSDCNIRNNYRPV